MLSQPVKHSTGPTATENDDQSSEKCISKPSDGRQINMEEVGRTVESQSSISNELNSETDIDRSLEETTGDEKPIQNPNKRGKFCLLDEPVLVEGKRKRHSVERLAATPSAPIKKINIDAVGTGIPLGNINYVNACMSKQPSDSLKSLHRLCFGTLGTATTRKRDLRKFNGYDFEEKSTEYEKKKTMAMKLTTVEINGIAKILGAERGHTKEELVNNVLRFLSKPVDTGKKIPEAKKRKKSSSGKKIPRETKQGRKAKKEKTSKSVDTDETDGDINESDESENKDAAESDSNDGKEGIKTEQVEVKTLKKKENSTSEHDISNSSDQSHASANKDYQNWGIGGPTNEMLDAAINEILKSVDLVSCTMKQMCERVAKRFPSLDLEIHKSALKGRVKAALEKMEDA